MSRLHRGRRWLRAQLLEHARAIGLTGDEELGSEPAASLPRSKEASLKDAARAGEGAAGERVSAPPVELDQYRRSRRAR